MLACFAAGIVRPRNEGFGIQPVCLRMGFGGFEQVSPLLTGAAILTDLTLWLPLAEGIVVFGKRCIDSGKMGSQRGMSAWN